MRRETVEREEIGKGREGGDRGGGMGGEMSEEERETDCPSGFVYYSCLFTIHYLTLFSS